MASSLRSSLLRQGTLLSQPMTLCRRAPLQLSLTPATRTAAMAPRKLAPFHTSSPRQILPPLPQTVEGTVNDAAPVPAPEPTHGSYHWTFERVLAAGLVPLTLTPFASGSASPALDAVLCAAILVHSHMGLKNIIVDYVPRKRLPRARKAFTWGLNAATALVAIGLYEFETNDVGVVEAVKRIWKA